MFIPYVHSILQKKKFLFKFRISIDEFKIRLSYEESISNLILLKTLGHFSATHNKGYYMPIHLCNVQLELFLLFPGKLFMVSLVKAFIFIHPLQILSPG